MDLSGSREVDKVELNSTARRGDKVMSVIEKSQRLAWPLNLKARQQLYTVFVAP